jgi:hypothetical protein
VIDAAGKPKRADRNCPPEPTFGAARPGYGHTPRPEIYKLKWSVGIDTACVMGGHLTAYILPEKRYVQVKARRNTVESAIRACPGLARFLSTRARFDRLRLQAARPPRDLSSPARSAMLFLPTSPAVRVTGPL